MAWAVTLQVVDCASPSKLLSGATVYSPYLTPATGYTDANGEYIIAADDSYDFIVVTIGKAENEPCKDKKVNPTGDPGYINKNFNVDKANNGKVQQVCLNKAPWPDCTQTGLSCFIVTATTGSPESVEVNRLRELRDRVSTASQFGAQLIDTIYGEYAQFSPRVAAELEDDEASREAVLQLVVRPLLAWYTLAGTLGLEDANRETISQAVRDVVNACPRYMGRSVVTMLEALRSGEALPEHAPPLVFDLVPRVAHLPYASWAILDPLIRAWRSATDNLDLIEEVAQWLSSAPLESLAPASDPKQLDRELAVLADFLDFRPMARRQLGERLVAAWPDAAGALEHAGFVS
jgi:hypothetical protein